MRESRNQEAGQLGMRSSSSTVAWPRPGIETGFVPMLAPFEECLGTCFWVFRLSRLSKFMSPMYCIKIHTQGTGSLSLGAELVWGTFFSPSPWAVKGDKRPTGPQAPPELEERSGMVLS